MLPPADPAGEKPRRDHRSLAHMSRHEVPKTVGKDDPGIDIRPRQGVALIRESSNRCDTLAGSGLLALLGPRVFGATPLDHVAKKRAPTRGASSSTPHTD